MDSVPLINISTYKPANMEERRARQQLPNRERTIIRHAKDPHVNRHQHPPPRIAFPRAANASNRFGDLPYQKNDFSWDAEQDKRSSSTEFAAQNYLPKRNDWESRRPGNSGNSFRHPVRPGNGPQFQYGMSPKADNLAEITSFPKSTADVAKKVKVKPALSIPTTPKDVSKNWEAIKESVSTGSKRKSMHWKQKIVQPLNAATKTNDPEIDPEPVIKEADADSFVKTKSFSGLTKTVAMDCEFVGIGPGGMDHMLARVSIVNQFGHCVYDTFVKPTELVKDYRTHVSGVRPKDLKTGEEFKVVQQKVAEILKGRILVGHAIRNDLEVLLLSHPKKDIRDTSKYKPFRTLMKGGTPSLKRLTEKVLGFAVQTGEHDSIQDAQAAMRLYTMHKRQWESQLSFKGKKIRMQKRATNST